MKKNQRGFTPLLIIIAILIIGVAAGGIYIAKHRSDTKSSSKAVNSYKECADAGNPVMTSYPSQCAANGKTFTNPQEKAPAAPEAATPAQTDDEATGIANAIIKNCQLNGTAVPADVLSIVAENMKSNTMYTRSGNFASISAGCDKEPGGFRSFLQKNADATWKLLGNTQDKTISCAALDGTGFPSAITTQCFDQQGELRDIK